MPVVQQSVSSKVNNPIVLELWAESQGFTGVKIERPDCCAGSRDGVDGFRFPPGKRQARETSVTGAASFTTGPLKGAMPGCTGFFLVWYADAPAHAIIVGIEDRISQHGNRLERRA